MLYEFSGIFQFSLLSFFVVIYVQTLFMVLDLFNYNREVNLYGIRFTNLVGKV